MIQDMQTKGKEQWTCATQLPAIQTVNLAEGCFGK